MRWTIHQVVRVADLKRPDEMHLNICWNNLKCRYHNYFISSDSGRWTWKSSTVKSPVLCIQTTKLQINSFYSVGFSLTNLRNTQILISMYKRVWQIYSLHPLYLDRREISPSTTFFGSWLSLLRKSWLLQIYSHPDPRPPQSSAKFRQNPFECGHCQTNQNKLQNIVRCIY